MLEFSLSTAHNQIIHRKLWYLSINKVATKKHDKG